MVAESGQLVVTQRGISQDAEQAMRGDPVRALIELITNADDAYQGSEGGLIRIEITRQGSLIKTMSVTDNALGLDAAGMKRCFTTLGDETSRINDGVAARGIFGRGAKDTAWFGRTEFESVKNGQYNRLVLSDDSMWELDEPQVATEQLRSLLNIPGNLNGLRATVYVHRNVRTTAAELMRKLSTHVQLRDVYERRQVLLIEKGGRTQTNRVVWTPPTGEKIVDTSFELPGYEGRVHLELIKMDVIDSNKPNEYSNCGIEVYGATSGYENTFFGFSDPGIHWIHGRLTSPEIDRLVRMYDVADSDLNPIRLVSRDRDGLLTEHPYYQALRAKVTDIVAPICAQWSRQGPSQVGGSDLRRDMSDAARVIGALLKEDLGPNDENEAASPTQSAPLVLIPPRVKLGIGSTKTLSVRLLADITSEPAFDVIISNPSFVRRVAAQRDVYAIEGTNHLGWNFQVEGLDLGATEVTIVERVSNRTAVSQVSVVVPEEDLVRQPEILQFATPSISVTKGKTRTVRVLAPIELAERSSGGLVVTLQLEGSGCELLDSTARLSLNRDGYLEGKVRIKGINTDMPLLITAFGAGQSAIATVRVVEPRGLNVGDLEIKLKDDFQGNSRGSLFETDEGRELQVYCGHPGIKQLLGRRVEVTDDEVKFENESSPTFRAALAELMTSVVVDFILADAESKQPGNFSDVGMVISERNRLVTKYLGRLQELLLRGGE
jgi:hypothetical protein